MFPRIGAEMTVSFAIGLYAGVALLATPTRCFARADDESKPCRVVIISAKASAS